MSSSYSSYSGGLSPRFFSAWSSRTFSLMRLVFDCFRNLLNPWSSFCILSWFVPVSDIKIMFTLLVHHHSRSPESYIQYSWSSCRYPCTGPLPKVPSRHLLFIFLQDGRSHYFILRYNLYQMRSLSWVGCLLHPDRPRDYWCFFRMLRVNVMEHESSYPCQQ